MLVRRSLRSKIQGLETAWPEIHASRNIYFWAFTWSPANTDLTEILLPPEHLCHIVLDLLCRSASKNAAKRARYGRRNLALLNFFSCEFSTIFQNNFENLHWLINIYYYVCSFINYFYIRYTLILIQSLWYKLPHSNCLVVLHIIFQEIYFYIRSKMFLFKHTKQK